MVVFSVTCLVVFALHELTALEQSRRANDALGSIHISDRIAGFPFHRQDSARAEETPFWMRFSGRLFIWKVSRAGRLSDRG